MSILKVDASPIVVVKEYTGDAATEVLREEFEDGLEAEATARTNGLNIVQATLTAQIAANLQTTNSQIESLESDLEDEITARGQAITQVNTAISAETAARTQAITQVNTDISAESTARQQAITEVSLDIQQEVQDRQNSFSSLSAAIIQQGQNTNNAISSLNNAFGLVTDGLSDRIDQVETDISAETAARTQAITQVNTAISAEATARTQAITQVNTAISAETAARTQAITQVNTDISAEAAARTQAITQVNTAISAEATARTQAITQVNTDISAETTARTQAITQVNNDISAEATARTQAITQVNTAISAEAAARTQAINSVNQDLQAESETREAADLALTKSLQDLVGKIFSTIKLNGFHDDQGNKYLLALINGSKVGFGITNKLKMIWAGSEVGVERVSGIRDKNGNYAVAVTKNGKVYIPRLVLPASVQNLLSSLSSQITNEVSARILGDSTNAAANAATQSSLTGLLSNFALKVNVHDDQGNKFLLAFVNQQGKIAWGVTKKGEIYAFGAKHQGSRLAFDVKGKDGVSALLVTKSGKVIAPQLVLPKSLTAQLQTLTTNLSLEQSRRIAETIQLMPVVWYDINHVLWNGQSLSVGSESVPLISTSQPYSNLMIASGVRPVLGEADYNGAGFTPLVELVQASNPSVGESPVSGTLNGFVQRVVSAGGTAASRTMLGTASGAGSRRVSQLLDEANFHRIRKHVSEAKRIADSLGKTYAVTALCWAQGESDIGTGSSGNTSFLAYYQDYLTLMAKTRQVVVEASNQPFMPYIFSYQTSGHQSYNKQTLRVPMAQWRASVELKDVVLATPSYRLPCAADNLHLTAEGSWLLGQYVARAMYWTFELGQKWRPLEPVDVVWGSSHIDIKYHVPCKPIQLSTAICTAVTNSGFDIWTSSNTLISNAISNVTVLSEDTIRIHLNNSATIPNDAVLCYGRSRVGDPVTSGSLNNPPKGNVLDSHGLYDSVTAPTTGTVYNLSNVAVLFSFNRVTGFH